MADQDPARLMSMIQRRREQAEALLRGLFEARRECEAQLNGSNRVDAIKQVTGCSSIDNAIAETKRIIAALDRALEEARRQLAGGVTGIEVVMGGALQRR